VIIRALTATGDWQFGRGIQDYLRNEQAIALNVKTRLRSFLNDNFWATDFGIDWWNLLGQKNPAAQTGVLLACREMLANSYGVVRINSVAATTEPVTRKLTITYNIDTVFSRSVTGTIQP